MHLFPWHLTFLLAVAYVLWHFVARYPLRSEDHKKADLGYVNFGMAFTLSVLCFACLAYIYYPSTERFPKVLLQVAYVTWTFTTCAILWRSTFPTSIKIIAFPLLVGTALLHYLYKGELKGVTGFIEKLDEFTKFGGGEKGSGLKLSMLLKWAFFFFNGFIVLNYYGKIFEIIHRDRIKAGIREEGLQEEAISRAILVISMALAFFIGLILAGAEIGKLSLFSGLVAAGVSIALKDLLANMAAGILLLWDKSIKTNDVIALDKERFGIVRSMTMRYLVLEDRNDIRFLVPNSELINKTITNWTQYSRRIRLKLDVGVSYDCNVGQVKDTMKEVTVRVARVLQEPPPRVLVLGFGDSTVHFQLRFFIGDPENGIRNVMSEIYELLLIRFREANIKIPFPQREIRVLPYSSLDIEMSQKTPTWLGRITATKRVE
ncbi:MAG: mechanosensitive ion channel protein MscS [Acidobacteria bacterium]|nr:mechanosensitive ion channel protein MscS [Acidobacteriota bacterium]